MSALSASPAAALPASAAEGGGAHPSLAAWTGTLVADGVRPSRVLCLPLSASNDVFSAVALYPDGAPPKWFAAPAAGSLFAGDEADLARRVEALQRRFDVLYTQFGGVNVHDVPGVRSVEGSVDHFSTAHTCTLFLLPRGQAVCFERQLFFESPKLVVLQRCAYSSARTFDALWIPPSHAYAREVRLIDKRHVPAVSEWALHGGAVVLRAPGSPIPARLLLQLFREGMTAEDVARAFVDPHFCVGSDDSGSDAADHESDFVPSASDSDTESDSDYEVPDAEAALALLAD